VLDTHSSVREPTTGMVNFLLIENTFLHARLFRVQSTIYEGKSESKVLYFIATK